MDDDFNLDRYLGRIRYGGATTPTLETLAAIQAHQVDAIPFENLDPLLGRPVRLDLASLQAKLVDGRRGGYCFEVNGLLKAALEALGFSVTGLAGRVRWMSPPEAPPTPRTHMTLRVELDGASWLVDAGFGAQLLDTPLRLEPDIVQETPHAAWRLDLDEGAYSLFAHTPEGWRAGYAFRLEPQVAADYEMGNWFTSTRPDSLFRNALVLERLTPEVRRNLVNLRLVERRRGGGVIERTLTGAADLAVVLEESFGIDPPAPADDILARLPAA